MSRPDFPRYFLGVAEAIKERADCTRRLVGAVTFDTDGFHISSGYNGTRPGAPGCLAGACPRGRLTYDQVAGYTDYSDPNSPGYCISNHAEMNAIILAGARARGASMAVTAEPCPACFKVIYNVGMMAVYWPEGQKIWS